MKFRVLLSSVALSLAASLAAAPASILQIRDSLHTVPVVYPESFETDVHRMQHNWYLRQYADLDSAADTRASVVTPSDQEFVERLGAMPTVIEMPFNSSVKSMILMYVDRKKQLVENMLGMSLYYMPIFEQALDRHGLPLELKYLPVIESALNPDAVSKAGATGLWQFMMETATGEGLEVNSLIDQRRDPYASSEAAAVYLKKLFDIYNDWSLAIAAYNCGPGNVNKAIRRAGGGKKDFWEIYPYLPSETRGYVPAFIAANYAMTYYNLHNISPALARRPILTDTVRISKRVHFEQISDVLGIPMEEIQTFNPQYRTGLIPGDIKPYSLVLPSLQVYAYLANEDSIVNHNAERYARRGIVEPAVAGSGRDSQGEYVEELVVKYHTVKKGETLTSIARKYGVTAASIRQTNKIGKNVTRGKKLRINTYQRKYIEATPEQPSCETTDSILNPEVAVGDSATVAQTYSELTVATPVVEVVTEDTSVATEHTAAEIQSSSDSRVAKAMAGSTAKKEEATKSGKQPTQKATTSPKGANSQKSSATQQQQRPTTHTVKKGENLSKIASRYGVTVEALRSANAIKGDAIRAGQKLTIPSKKPASSKSSSRKR